MPDSEQKSRGHSCPPSRVRADDASVYSIWNVIEVQFSTMGCAGTAATYYNVDSALGTAISSLEDYQYMSDAQIQVQLDRVFNGQINDLATITPAPSAVEKPPPLLCWWSAPLSI